VAATNGQRCEVRQLGNGQPGRSLQPPPVIDVQYLKASRQLINMPEDMTPVQTANFELLKMGGEVANAKKGSACNNLTADEVKGPQAR